MMLMRNQRISFEHGLEPVSGTTRLVPYLSQLIEVTLHVASMPGDKDRIHVREVFVKRRAADAGFFGDLGHGDGRQPLFRDELRRGVEDGVIHRAPVRLDGLGPQFRHTEYMRRVLQGV
jgi:hypothetical protein